MKKTFFYFVILFGLITFLFFYGMSLDSIRAEQDHPIATEVTKMVEVTTATLTEKTTAEQAPGFTLKTLSGKQIALSDYHGRYVLLNMWASWCGPCQDEMPHLVSIDHKYDDKRLTVLGVNMTSQELSVKNVRNFVKKYEAHYPILLDEKGKVMDLYHTVGIPTSYLLDKKGRIIRQFRGIITMDGIKKEMKNVEKVY